MYIVNMFPNDIIHCTACHEMISRGVRCYTRNCEGYFTVTSMWRAGQTCPVCDSPLHGDSEGKLKRILEGSFVEGQDKHTRTRGADDGEGEEEEVRIMRARMGKMDC